MRTWRALKDVIYQLSDDMKIAIYEAACTKSRLTEEIKLAGKKRKREKTQWSRHMHRRLDDGEYHFILIGGRE